MTSKGVVTHVLDMSLSVAIGLLSGAAIVFLFTFLEKTRIPQINGERYLFLMIMLVISFLSRPSYSPSNLFIWIFMLPVFYNLLDDLISYTFDVIFDIFSFLLLSIWIWNIDTFLSALGVFVFFYFISLLTKEKFFGMGESFLFSVMTVWLGFNYFLLSFLISMCIAIIVIGFLLLFKRKTQYPFSPFILLSSALLSQSIWRQHLYGFVFYIGWFAVLLSIFMIIGKIFIFFKKKC